MKCVSAALGLALTSMLFVGCASVTNGTRQQVALSSAPGGAKVIVYNNQGEIAFQGKTPCVATLRRTAPESDRANYIVLFQKEGFQDAQLPLTSHLNSAGAVSALFAGAGLLLDSDLGGAWTLSAATDGPKLIQSTDLMHPESLCLALAPSVAVPSGVQVGSVQR